MAKFIELHDADNGDSVLLNLDAVRDVMEVNNFAEIMFCDGSVLTIMEKYHQVKLLIGTAQGGIPMEPGKMY